MPIAALPVRSAKEIGERLLATFLCNAVAVDPELRVEILEWIAAQHFETIFSPRETAFLANPEPSERDLIQFGWYVEVTVVLGWAAGLLESLPAPQEQSFLGELVDRIPVLGEPLERFISEVCPRPAAIIHEARQCVEDLHARAISDHARGAVIRYGTDIEVAQEQHRALNWLACVEDAEWDLVPTDT